MLGNDPYSPLSGQQIDEKLFRLLVACVNDYAIFLIDQNGHILSWNHGAENIKGYKADEIVGRHISLFYTADDNQKNVPRHNLNAALKKGSHESEGWRIRKDGSRFWAHITFNTVYDDKGHLVGFAKITRDFTDRKKIEDEKAAIHIELEKRVQENTARIISNERRFRKLIENSYDGISLLDQRLNVFYRSLSSERIMGWSNFERGSYHFKELIHPDDHSLFNDAFNEVLNKPLEPVLITYRALHKQGHYIWIECLFTNMLFDDYVNAIVCNFRDITERKKAEQEIKLLTETLEKKVIARTEQLQVANKELESFSYSVSHDLRTPLRAISGYATMLKEDFQAAINAEGNRVINTIIGNARLMGQLIDDLLAFSRLGKQSMALKEVDMYALAQGSIKDLLENEPRKYKIQVADLPSCKGDRNMIRQVLMNIISNAIKYSAKVKQPLIEIGFMVGEDAHTYYVKDNGVGFDPQYSSKLFGVFQRLHRNDEFEGNGVGLALAKKIIEKHDGSIWAEAEPGAGATFYFSLPFQ